MKNLIKSVKGTRDFYPEIMSIRNWLYSHVRKVSELFGYIEYEGPLLESLDLYAAKSGDELVKEQSFVFPDRSGDLITLRPELTPTLARMVAQRQKQLLFPLRWWSFGPFWRYERPQKGRAREFFQWNVDLVGVNSAEADAEIIAIIATFLKSIGLSSHLVKILINDRQLVEEEFKFLSIPTEKHQSVFRLIDRKEKMSAKEWESYAVDLGLPIKQIDGLCKILEDMQLWQKSKNITNVFFALEALGVLDYVQYHPSIIRGLDYYTSTVFEAKEIEGELRRSILGGGRYDNLLTDIGGDQLPAVGFAMGDVVITLISENKNIIPVDVSLPPAKIMVAVFNQTLFNEALQISNAIRQAGINTLLYPEAVSLSKQYKFAAKSLIRYVILVGPEELINETVAIKDLSTGDQLFYKKSEMITGLTKLLDK